MANTTTSETTIKIIQFLKAKKYFVWRQNNIPPYDTKTKSYRRLPKGSIKGVPDIIGFDENGRFVGIEIKATGKLTDPQKYFAETANKSGCIMLIVKDFDDFIRQWGDTKDK